MEQLENDDELIIVYRDSDTATGEYARLSASDHKKIKTGSVNSPGHLPPLIRGRDLASGDIIAFVDDDASICDGWVRRLKLRYSDPWIGGVGGPVQQIRDGVVQTPVLRKKVGVITWYGKVIGGLDGTITDETRAVSLLPGGNMSFRREALNKVRFDMKLNEGAAVNFEADLCLQIKKMGYDILFDRKIEIAHYNAPRQIAERRDDKTLYSNQYSHNYVYLALKHFNYLQKCAFLIYFFSIGQKVAPGIGLYLWYALKRDHRKRLYWSSNAGKARGVISYVDSVRGNEQ